MRERFRIFSQRVSNASGTPMAFALAVLAIILWALSGPFFGYSNTWQLIINTGTTIVTFLMVFLIQNTQNRDARAIHAKLDELIRANSKARNSLIDLEDLSDHELEHFRAELNKMRKESSGKLEKIKETRSVTKVSH